MLGAGDGEAVMGNNSVSPSLSPAAPHTLQYTLFNTYNVHSRHIRVGCPCRPLAWPSRGGSGNHIRRREPLHSEQGTNTAATCSDPPR